MRALVPHENAVAGLDLGEKKQALAVTGADGQVLARRSPQVSVHDLGPYLDWAAGQARAAGYAGLSVACALADSGPPAVTAGRTGTRLQAGEHLGPSGVTAAVGTMRDGGLSVEFRWC